MNDKSTVIPALRQECFLDRNCALCDDALPFAGRASPVKVASSESAFIGDKFLEFPDYFGRKVSRRLGTARASRGSVSCSSGGVFRDVSRLSRAAPGRVYALRQERLPGREPFSGRICALC